MRQPQFRNAPKADIRRSYAEPTISGGTNARTGGSGPVQRSISTMVVAELGPWPSFEVPRSWVSTLALPCAQRAVLAAGRVVPGAAR